ncbi:fluoride efflux transporter CrcB [Sphingomonas sp.]|uniref:fluoride efflux transporter CrcB n=1 Tax=Sphingomonas sp. TaxID=28214 RepID=UPI00286D5115|nr:fluoride efflux transporter CrcB [Sphingomonas sp.]
MGSALLVFIGGGIGAVLRHAVGRVTVMLGGTGFPVGTMIVNMLGSLIMGLLAGWFATHPGVGQSSRLFLITGVLGGFTTFSAFSLDALTLYQRGEAGLAFGYVGLSVILSLAAIAIGYSLIR